MRRFFRGPDRSLGQGAIPGKGPDVLKIASAPLIGKSSLANKTGGFALSWSPTKCEWWANPQNMIDPYVFPMTLVGLDTTGGPAVVGTFGDAGSANGARVSCETDAITGEASIQFYGTRFTLEAGPVFTFVVETGNDLTDLAIECSILVDLDVIEFKYFGDGYAGGPDDVNWIARTTTGSGGSEETNDTGIAVVVDTVYNLQIDCRDNAAIKFYINGDLVAVNTAVPDTTWVGVDGAVFFFSNDGAFGVPQRINYIKRVHCQYH